jgi:hypothetical protein
VLERITGGDGDQMASNAPLGHVGFLGHPTSSMWPYLPLSTFILFFFLFIDINYFLENTTTTSNRQRIITISIQPRQDALPLYEIASSSTVYGFYFLLIFPIIPFTFLLQFSFQSFHF